MTKHYDYIAIGGGSGGIASINRAAMYGQKCALIEAKELGRWIFGRHGAAPVKTSRPYLKT